MKLELRELRILSRLTYYEDALDLTLNEIDYDEKQEYMNDKENLKMTIAKWFCEYLSERIFKKEINGNTIYFFLNSCEDLYEEEFEEIINKLNFSSEEEFYEEIKTIFEENNYDGDEDYFEYFDDEYEEEE